MLRILKEIFEYRDLLWMLTLRDIKIRYKQTMMGFVWAIFMPIIAVCAGIVIKKAIAVVAQRPLGIEDIITISIKVLPWTFFVSSIRFAVQSLVGNSDLVSKIYFPRAVLPFSSILACFFDFSIAAFVLTVILVILKIGVSIYLLWLPIVLLFLFTFTFGLSLLLSAANLFFRDVKYIVEIILMFGIFFTPVFYDAEIFGNLKTLLLLNPMGSILESLNQAVVLKRMPDLIWLGYAGACSFLMFYLGMVVFYKKEQLFAENI